MRRLQILLFLLALLALLAVIAPKGPERTALAKGTVSDFWRRPEPVHAVPARDHGERTAEAKTRAGFGIDHADCDTRRLLVHSNKRPRCQAAVLPLQRCHDWINIVSILGDHRLLELLVQTSAERMGVDFAQKKGQNSESSTGYRRRDRLLSNSCRTYPCLVRSGERSALLCV